MENNRNTDYLADDVEKWYDKLKDYTFKTLIMELNLATAKAIINRYEKRDTPEDNKLLEKVNGVNERFNEQYRLISQLFLILLILIFILTLATVRGRY
jgi:hypothetical protein